MTEKEKTAIPNMSVDAGMEQPISKNSIHSITDDSEDFNDFEENSKKFLERMREMNLPGYMHTVTMSELYENIYPSRPPIIDGLLYPGTYLFAGSPKVGKSFFMSQLAYHSAVLDISGRDQQDQRLYLSRDAERLTWNLEKAETELWEEPVDPILEAVSKIVTSENAEWIGSPTELANTLGIDIKPNTLSLRLNVKAGRLLDEYNIRYENKRTHAGRSIKLTLQLSEV